MSEFVVDASVALKWLVPEADSEAAERFLASGAVLHAPRFLAIETANAAWKNWRKGLVDQSIPLAVFDRLQGLVDAWHANEGLFRDAMTMAVALGHPVFDCLYLVLARTAGTQVVTADKRMLAIAPPGLAIALEDWRP